MRYNIGSPRNMFVLCFYNLLLKKIVPTFLNKFNNHINGGK